jgi:hypothetical protein
LKKLKVITIVGTRPEIIRLSCVIQRLRSEPAIEHLLVHTGQNYDYELNEIFFEDLQLDAPDRYLKAVGKNVAVYSDTSVRTGVRYFYRVFATNRVGDTWTYPFDPTMPPARFPTMTVKSAWSNVVSVTTP